MAARRAMTGAVVAMAVALLCSSMANAEVDCSSEFNAMQPCIEYVNSNTSAPPSKPCCTAFNATQINTPVCLCQLQQAFADPATAPGNVTRANLISTLCAVAVDPSRCPALLGLAPAIAPVAAPVIAPVAAPVIAPVAAPVIAPVAAPVIAPVAAPVIAPVAAPVIAPVAAPAKSPSLPPAAAAPSDANVDCSSEFDSLSSCISYVSSNTTTPPATCCSALLSVHTNKPVCLCQLLQDVNADPSQSSGLNVTKALELPTACNVNGADVSNCPALLGQPIASPVSAPGPDSTPTPEGAAPGIGTTTPAPETSPAVTTPPGNGVAKTATASSLIVVIALTSHFLMFW